MEILTINFSMRDLMNIGSVMLLVSLVPCSAMAQPLGAQTTIDGTAKKNPIIASKPDFGEITAELYADKAPVTVANFLSYITEKKIHNATFYRVVRTEPDNQPDKTVKIQVLQGGLTDVPDEELPKIKHE